MLLCNCKQEVAFTKNKCRGCRLFLLTFIRVPSFTKTWQFRKEKKNMVKSNQAPLAAPLILTNAVHLQPSGRVILGQAGRVFPARWLCKRPTTRGGGGQTGWVGQKRKTQTENNALIRVIPCQDELGPVGCEHCTLCWSDATGSPEK